MGNCEEKSPPSKTEGGAPGNVAARDEKSVAGNLLYEESVEDYFSRGESINRVTHRTRRTMTAAIPSETTLSNEGSVNR